MGEDSMLIWGVGLLALAIVLIVVEVFVPSMGLIALTGVGVTIAGLYCLFVYDTLWGLIGLLAVFILMPMAWFFALNMLPGTPIGRRILGERPPEVIEEQERAERDEREKLLALVGAEGVVVTDLRPVGVVTIDGKRFDALSETSLIPAGARVKVTLIEGKQIKVREI